MARNYSSAYKSTLAQTSAIEAPLMLLEITHPALAQPVRAVSDTLDITSNGNLFVAVPFRCSLPEDMENQLPKARLAIDNVGRELTYWLEVSGGGEGSSVRLMQVMRSVPDLIEWEITMQLANVSLSMGEVSADLNFENLFARPAAAVQYRPDTAPGVF